MAKITYTNKVALNENPEIALINKVTDDDLNEIKSVVNTNDDNVGDLTNLTTTTKTSIVAAVNELDSDKAEDDIILVQSTEPTSDSNILWINDGQIGTPASEITNSYSTSTGIGYSANYVNNLHTYSTDEIRVGTWTDGKPLYRKVLTDTSTTSGDHNISISNTNYDFVMLESWCIRTSNYVITNWGTGGANDFCNCWINTNTKNVIYNVGSSWANCDFTGVIIYTKTTD